MALDESGDTLREAVRALDLEPPPTPFGNGRFLDRRTIGSTIDNGRNMQQESELRSVNSISPGPSG